MGNPARRKTQRFAPGARVLVRDAEWLVRRVDRTSTGGQALSVVGLSEVVRDKEALFLDEAEKSIEALDPAATELVRDESSSYRSSLLYMEALLRRTPPTDEHLHIGHRAAMDPVPYQLEPAARALRQPRQRILVADAVGLGKTLEAGVLLSELVRRGRAKRILVLAVKSMLTQFQKEMWSRFTIPLTRLDSVGVQRIRARIPVNHNPFYYYDKAIVSIDTLKQDAEYRAYLENAYWDVIVVDEAHNVAERSHGSSLRSRLARLLARRSDTLIMLSATPHDGKPRSFASLMNMLDPTAIADPDDYTHDDIKGLFVRRFKKDIQRQVETAFKERTVGVARCRASEAEERVHDALAEMRFTRLDRDKGAGELFRTTLEKALFSSPAACLSTVRNRLGRLRRLEDPAFEKDIRLLEELAGLLEAVAPGAFGKYRKLVELLARPGRRLAWTADDPGDRLVVFTERIETLRFLRENLPRDLGLEDRRVEILHGAMSDVEQQRVVEQFGRDEAPVRLLVASDVASEGINLHYLCHRMIHFDIPWSLMVFQQRNGRIDRYGQERAPEILYLVTESENERIRGDTRILELLAEKDEQAVKNIGDPSALMGVYDVEEEERITARAMEARESPADFGSRLDGKMFDPLAVMLGEEEAGGGAEAETRVPPSLFPDDFAYLRAALESIGRSEPIQADYDPDRRRVELTMPEELRHRFRFFPREIRPEDGRLHLSADTKAIREEIRRSRKDEKAWPRIHYLWELHPVMDWVNDKVLSAFRRRQAPVIALPDRLDPGEAVFVLSGLIPNRKSHPLLHRWFGVRFRDGRFQAVEPFEDLLERTGLGREAFPNRGGEGDTEPLRGLLPEAVERAREWMRERRRAFEDEINEKLNEHLEALERLRDKQYACLEARYGEGRQPEKLARSRKEKERREIDRIFDDYLEWVEDTMTTEDEPCLQVVAVLRGGS